MAAGLLMSLAGFAQPAGAAPRSQVRPAEAQLPAPRAEQRMDRRERWRHEGRWQRRHHRGPRFAGFGPGIVQPAVTIARPARMVLRRPAYEAVPTVIGIRAAPVGEPVVYRIERRGHAEGRRGLGREGRTARVVTLDE